MEEMNNMAQKVTFPITYWHLWARSNEHGTSSTEHRSTDVLWEWKDIYNILNVKNRHETVIDSHPTLERPQAVDLIIGTSKDIYDFKTIENIERIFKERGIGYIAFLNGKTYNVSICYIEREDK